MFNQIRLKRSQINELIDKLSNFHKCDLEELKSYNFYLNQTTSKIHITKVDIEQFSNYNVSGFGLYFGTIHNKERFRLSVEGSQLIDPKSNYISIGEKTLKSYLTGENLFKQEIDEINHKDNCPFLIVMHKGERLGCVNIREDEVFNYIPKSRRLDFNKVF